MTARRPRVALVAIGIGRVQRGFERYFQDLFGVLRDEIDVTLFKSGGTRTGREKVPPMLGLLTAMTRKLPLGTTEYHRDCVAFALAMLPQLLFAGFDIVHCIDPPMAQVLSRLKRWGLLPPKLLFTEGCTMPPQHYPQADHVHHVAAAAHETGIAYGHPRGHLTLAPCGLQTERFPLFDDRAALRQKHGISDTTFVVLSVCAIKRLHKRVDHLVDEIARLDGDVLLWLDGNPEDAEVVRIAHEKLGSRVCVTHVSSAQVPELYRLADVMALASLSESFSLALAEAMCSGTMVLAHNAPHFEWLIQDRSCLVDMSIMGAAASRLAELRASPPPREHLNQRAAVLRQRFDWQSVKPLYVEMYRRVEGSLNDGDELNADAAKLGMVQT